MFRGRIRRWLLRNSELFRGSSRTPTPTKCRRKLAVTLASFGKEVGTAEQFVGTALAAVRENTKIHGQFVGDDAHIVPKSTQISVGNAVLSVPKKLVISDRLRL